MSNNSLKRSAFTFFNEDKGDIRQSSLVFVDDSISREEAGRKCDVYGFHTPSNTANMTELSSIMYPNETAWTFRDDDRHKVILNRQWLSTRGM
jgi:hypothetical protein